MDLKVQYSQIEIFQKGETTGYNPLLKKQTISAIVFQLLIYFIDFWDTVLLSPGQHLEQDTCCQSYLMNHFSALV